MRCVRCGNEAPAGRADPVGRASASAAESRRRFTTRSMSAFSGHCFPDDVIALAVRWYARFRLELRRCRGVARGARFSVDRSAVYRWVQRFLPLFGAAARRHRRRVGKRWRVDETYCAFNGSHAYIYRAIDQMGKWSMPTSPERQHRGPQGPSSSGRWWRPRMWPRNARDNRLGQVHPTRPTRAVLPGGNTAAPST